MVFSFVLCFFYLFLSSMFILYASFLDFFWNGFGVLFWIGWGFALSAFFFCAMFLVGGRSFPFWLLFIRYWVSLVSLILGGFFMSDAFLRFCYGRVIFLLHFSFHLSFICCHLAPPLMIKRLGREG